MKWTDDRLTAEKKDTHLLTYRNRSDLSHLKLVTRMAVPRCLIPRNKASLGLSIPIKRTLLLLWPPTQLSGFIDLSLSNTLSSHHKKPPLGNWLRLSFWVIPGSLTQHPKFRPTVLFYWITTIYLKNTGGKVWNLKKRSKSWSSNTVRREEQSGGVGNFRGIINYVLGRWVDLESTLGWGCGCLPCSFSSCVMNLIFYN